MAQDQVQVPSILELSHPLHLFYVCNDVIVVSFYLSFVLLLFSNIVRDILRYIVTVIAV